MFISNYNFIYSDKGDLVYFDLNLTELLGITISHHGIKSVLRNAFRQSRLKTPIKTGILRRSYTMEYLDNVTVRCFFDPNKMIGKIRYGKPVEVYYAKYLADHIKTYSWLDLVMQEFLKVLLSGIRELNRQELSRQDKMNKDKELFKQHSELNLINTIKYMTFISLFNEEVKRKIKDQIEQEEKKNEFKNIKILVHKEQEILK